MCVDGMGWHRWAQGICPPAHAHANARKHAPPSKSQQETADKMLHSVEMSNEYAKHTPDES